MDVCCFEGMTTNASRSFWQRTRIRVWLFCMLLQVLGSLTLRAQWTSDIHANFGCNVFLHWSKAQKFPGLRVFGALSIVGTYRETFMVHYGPSISIYTKTIGANLNPLVNDIQLDFTHSFSAGVGWGDRTSYPKLTRTTHTGDYYNLVIRKSNALLLSTNFLFNNHRRHQAIGSANLTIGPVSINYNNDGVPFGDMMLADGFDRYWTGGGAIMVHSERAFNYAELSFDQFTGYQPLLYELSNIIGINVPLYSADSASQRKRTPGNYNTSMYQLKIGLDPYASVDIGLLGSMYAARSRKFWGVQDIIHLRGRYPFHPNTDKTRFFFGGTYTNNRRL